MKKEELLKKMKQEGVFVPADGCIAALSGGCDSVSLLLLLHEWRKTEDFDLWAVHVNHGLRENAAADEEFCIRLCRGLDIPLIVFREDVRHLSKRSGLSLEEAGRNIRYERLTVTAEKLGLSQVAAAHQQDDQAETLILHLLRGSGLHGLSGMKPVRMLNEKVRLIRPLLHIPRTELEEFLREEKQNWREDESNREERFARNSVRNRVMPALRGIRPDAERALSSAADHLAEYSRFLEKTARETAFRAGIDPEKDSSLPLSWLKEADPVAACEIFRIWLDSHGGLRDVGERHYDMLAALIAKPSGSSADLPGGRRVLREQEDLRLIGVVEPGPMKAPRIRIETFSRKEGMIIPDSLYTKWMDYDIINEHLSLRNRKKGDYLILPDGGKKMLSRFMVDEKIPLSERDRIWVLAQGSHVLWVVGYRMSAAAKITDKTATVAQITVEESGEKEWKSM